MRSVGERLTKRAAAYRETFGTGSGAFVLADLSTRFRAMQTTYVRGDPGEGARREGERNVLLWIYSQLAMTDTDVREMIDQHSRSGDYLA